MLAGKVQEIKRHFAEALPDLLEPHLRPFQPKLQCFFMEALGSYILDSAFPLTAMAYLTQNKEPDTEYLLKL